MKARGRIVGEMLYGEGGENGASRVGRERPGENESRGVTPSEVQDSRFRTSTEGQVALMQGSEGGEEGSKNREKKGVHEAIVAKTRVEGKSELP